MAETATNVSRSKQAHLVHFLEDGFTAFGTVWYRGQEVEVLEGSDDWARTLDGEGNSWMVFSEDEQIDKYGKIMFRPGPWRGKDWNEEEAAEKEAQRRRQPPKSAAQPFLRKRL